MEAETHDLKVWPKFYDALEDGSKSFEVRRDDRDFRPGDHLILKEWDPKTQEYSGRQVKKLITYRLKGGDFGIDKQYCVLGIK